MCAHVWAGRQDLVISIEMNEVVLFMVLFGLAFVVSKVVTFGGIIFDRSSYGGDLQGNLQETVVMNMLYTELVLLFINISVLYVLELIMYYTVSLTLCQRNVAFQELDLHNPHQLNHPTPRSAVLTTL